ncbi:hypothetical protein BG005_009363 [Podila minutissima]|nr:hypothetical protein BG005_009363 [Podila minutissima]
MLSSVEAIPLLVAPSDSVATGTYVPLSERSFTAEQHAEHERILKRSSIGWNDWNCKPKPGKNPLVMVHGLVLSATGASKVNIFGHSEGSIVPRYYLKFLGGAAKIEKFAAMGPVVTGSTLQGLVPFLTGLGLYDPIRKVIDPVCLSCFQVLDNSPFLQALNAQGDTVPGVSYKFITSKADLLVTPYTAEFLRGNNPLVENVTLQDLCPVDLSGHIALCLDPIVFHSVRAFFDPTAPQNIGCLDALR